VPRTDATILHLDLDAFYASVEQLADPALAGGPVVVGGLGHRGVVAAASYEARALGVHSAMPIARARRLAPSAVYLPPRFDLYEAKSLEVMAILRDVTPLVEQLSIDEAFLDVAGIQRRHGRGADIARLLRARVRDEAGLAASVGVATTKFVAKLASDLAKPDGMLEVTPGTELAFLHPLSVRRLWGVGPATLRKLEAIGVHTIGDVAALPESILVAAVGAAHGRHLSALSQNRDERAVQTSRATKSIGAEETFPRDLKTVADVERELTRLCDKVAGRLRRAGVEARTVTLKARYGNFETHTYARTFPAATALSTVLAGTARELLTKVDVARGVRLVGVSASQLVGPGPVQTTLDLTTDGTGAGRASTIAGDRRRDERRADVERAVDEVRARFGERAVRPAVVATPAAEPDEANP
jgi:DNA polymerase-4